MSVGPEWASSAWESEARMFANAARVVLSHLVSEGRLVINEGLVRKVYPELARRMRDERGWWNPLVSPYTVYSFYSQATLVLSPARFPEEFERLHGARPEAVEELVRESALLVLLSSPHYLYGCECFERILEAQGSMPTTLRLTETLKAVLSRVRGEGPWDTRLVGAELLRAGLAEDDARDLATRLSDLAAFGYRRLASSLLEALLEGPSRERVALARSIHHIMVEPIIDSGGTFAVFSGDEIELARRLAESRSLESEHIGLLVGILWRVKAEAKLRVPRRVDANRLLSYATGEPYRGLHEMVLAYRRLLSREDVNADMIGEAARLARDIARRATSLSAPRLGSKRIALLGMIAQAPVQALLAGADALTVKGLVEAVLGTAGGMLSEKLVVRALSTLLERVETVYVLPVTPALYESV